MRPTRASAPVGTSPALAASKRRASSLLRCARLLWSIEIAYHATVSACSAAPSEPDCARVPHRACGLAALVAALVASAVAYADDKSPPPATATVIVVDFAPATGTRAWLATAFE